MIPPSDVEYAFRQATVAAGPGQSALYVSEEVTEAAASKVLMVKFGKDRDVDRRSHRQSGLENLVFGRRIERGERCTQDESDTECCASCSSEPRLVLSLGVSCGRVEMQKTSFVGRLDEDTDGFGAESWRRGTIVCTQYMYKSRGLQRALGI